MSRMVTDNPDGGGDGKAIVTFTAFFRGTPHEINNLRYRATVVQNALGVSKTETINRIFEYGLEQIEKECKDKIENKTAAAFAEKNREIDEQRQILSQLEKFYASMSPEDFLKFCENSEVPEDLVDKFMANYTWRNDDQRWASRAHDFLREALIDGEMKSTKEIRELAVESNIIEDTALDWQRLRTLASRDGLTNCPEHGHWQYKGLVVS